MSELTTQRGDYTENYLTVHETGCKMNIELNTEMIEPETLCILALKLQPKPNRLHNQINTSHRLIRNTD